MKGVVGRGLWPATVTEAVEIQLRLQGAVIDHDDFESLRCVAGVDVGFEKGGAIARAAVAVAIIATYAANCLRCSAVSRRSVSMRFRPGAKCVLGAYGGRFLDLAAGLQVFRE